MFFPFYVWEMKEFVKGNGFSSKFKYLNLNAYRFKTLKSIEISYIRMTIGLSSDWIENWFEICKSMYSHLKSATIVIIKIIKLRLKCMNRNTHLNADAKRITYPVLSFSPSTIVYVYLGPANLYSIIIIISFHLYFLLHSTWNTCAIVWSVGLSVSICFSVRLVLLLRMYVCIYLVL